MVDAIMALGEKTRILIPVSYTHLDVYKRQVYAWTALSIFWAIKGKSYAILWGYGLTLVLTSLLNFAFFYLNNPGAGTLILVAVLACGAWTARQAFARDTKAGIALLPLVFWSAFALVLNYAIYMSN